jgi:hypothetical protein
MSGCCGGVGRWSKRDGKQDKAVALDDAGTIHNAGGGAINLSDANGQPRRAKYLYPVIAVAGLLFLIMLAAV